MNNLRNMLALLALSALLLGALPGVGQTARWIPYGYDHPEADKGGPSLPEGFGWFDEVWPSSRNVTFAAKLPSGPLSVAALVNSSALASHNELTRRFPASFLLVTPPWAPCMDYKGREDFAPLLKAFKDGKKFDVFLISRVRIDTIPLDIQYEILRRVKEDGAGLVVSDVVGYCKTFNPDYMKLKPSRSGSEAIPGIPYAGLQEWAAGKEFKRNALNYWHSNGTIFADPFAKDYKYGNVQISKLGKGAVVWYSTGDPVNPHYGARMFMPERSVSRAMWAQNDYFYSHTVKAMMIASGRVRDAEIDSIKPSGKITDDQTPIVSFINPKGVALTGKLRWQIRDMWGITGKSGDQMISVPAGGGAIQLDGVKFTNAGRQYLDLWIENKDEETIDWGSTFVDVDRKVALPVITFKYPLGAPRGADLEGTITVKDAPAGATVRVTLIDRHWREVGRQNLPAGDAQYKFPSAGLDGQIWRVQADVVQKDGAILARNYLNVTSPKTPADNAGFHPLMTCHDKQTTEAGAQREYLRRIGFLANRQYVTGNDMTAEESLWNDVNMMPFPIRPTAPSNVIDDDHITDWDEPILRAELSEALTFLIEEMKPFGIRGFNLTDDSGPAGELTYGPYTTLRFHEWLKAKYGNFDAVCAAWGWNPPEEKMVADNLPADPYVTVRFHDWLKAKYATLNAVAKAWKFKEYGYGQFHTFGSIQRDLIAGTKGFKDNGKDLCNKDIAEFMTAFLTKKEELDPFGRIHTASIKAAYDQGKTAAWIDAQHYMQDDWVNMLKWAQEVGKKVDPNFITGTDASYYGYSIAEAFGAMEYVAPYYTDYSVKIAMSRGRMRKNGDFGACLGAYGDKPANMSGRRSQIWDTLLAGGTGFYYWMFSNGVGISWDLKLYDAHAKYQCEVTEEISRGISELCVGTRRIFHPVAILYSQTSGISDQLLTKLDPVTTQGNSAPAFQAAFEDLGLNPHTITQKELEDGWLEKNGVKILALPGVCSMSDAEMEAVKKFVKGGGFVIADIIPGVRQTNGNLRKDFPLAEVFGVSYDTNGKARVRGNLTGKVDQAGAELSFGDALADPRVKAAAAKALGKLDTAQTIFANTFGAGKAYLFNASFSSYATYRSEGGDIWTPWYEVMKKIAADSGLATKFPWTSNGKETPGFELSPFINGNGYLLGVSELGCADFAGARRPLEVTLPGTFNVYDVRIGKYLGELKTIKTDIPRGGHRLYALLPYKVTGVTLKVADASLNGGETIKLTADIQTSKPARDFHVLRLEAFTPDGKSFFPYQRVLKMPAKGAISIPLTTAANDMPGKWKFVATDINSGISEEITVTINKGVGQ